MSQGASGGHRWRTSVGTTAVRGPSLKTRRRVWATLVVLLGVVVIWLIWQFLRGGNKSQIVSIGMTYDNPVFRPTPFLLDSRKSLGELLTRDETEKQFLESSYPPGSDSRLDGGLELRGILQNDSFTKNKTLKNQNLLVYLNLQGGLIVQSGEEPGPAACFLTLRADADSLHEGSGGQRVLVRDLLSDCGNIPARNVIVLLEASGCGPNWRAGVLNRDFEEQLKKDVAIVVKEFPNLWVIGSVSRGETNDASRVLEGGRGQSQFSYFSVQGLLGEADDWRYDKGESFSPKAHKRKTRTVNFDELFAYLHGQVGARSKSHRAATQTVWRLPEGGKREPMELSQIRSSGRAADATNSAKELVEFEATATKEKKTTGKNDAKSSPPDKSTEEGKDAKETVADDKSSDAATADTTKTSAGDVAKSIDTKTPAQPALETASSKGIAVSGTDKPSAKADAEPDRQQLQVRMTSLWERRDLARQRGDAAWHAPREWRRLQLELVFAEHWLRDSNDLDRMKAVLGQAETTFDKIDNELRSFKLQRIRPAEAFVSLAWIKQSEAARAESTRPSTNVQKRLQELMKLAIPTTLDLTQPTSSPRPAPTPTTATDSKPAAATTDTANQDELKKLLLEYPQLRGQVWMTAFQPALKLAHEAKANGEIKASDFHELDAAISKAEELTKDRDGQSSVPAEIITVLGVVATAKASLNEQFRWSSDLSRAGGLVIDLRVRFEELVAQFIVESKKFRQDIQKVEDQLIAAERWVQTGQAELALQSLTQAETALSAAQKDAQILQRAAQLKASIAAELPDLARWVANRQDASGKGSIKSARATLKSFASERSSSVDDPADTVTDVRKFVDSQDAAWFRLFDVIEDATKLFAATSRDAPSNEITSLTNKLSDSWANWRSFDLEVQKLLSFKTPQPEHWGRLQDVLLVPWIPAGQRQQLLKRLQQLDEAAETDVKNVLPADPSRGDWQAFWAILTLRLAGLDTETEQALWKNFAKSLKTPIDDDSTESFSASAALGKDISRAFEKIKRKADAVATDLAARKEDVDPTRGEQLVRGVDPTDKPAADSQAEFWWAKRQVARQNEFIQDRASQLDAVAQLGGNAFSAQWASVANRWSSLRTPSDHVASVELAPFTLGKISNDLLSWTSGDPAEIKIPLSISPRRGVPHRETLVRVLDTDQLQVEPKTFSSSDGYEIEKTDESQEVTLSLRKPKSVTGTEVTITVVLIDKATQLPWDIRRLTLRTPLKDQDWKIEFRAKGEADRDDFVARDRNKLLQTAESYRTILWLPTAPKDKPLSLRPVLLPPVKTKLKMVEIKVFELDENGKPRPTPSALQKDIPLNTDGLPIPLNLASTPAAAAAPPVSNPKLPTPSATPPAGHVVSRGWLFEILPAGEATPVRQQVVPRVRPPQTYFNPSKIDVAFKNGELKFELHRRKDEEELDRALRPESVRVTLDLPKGLDVSPTDNKLLPTDNQLLWDFRRDERKNLVARFEPKQLTDVQGKTFLVTVNVGGWPRAFPYHVRYGNTAVEARPTRPVIVAPAAGRVIPVGDKLPIDVQIDSDRLDSFGLDEPWKLTCEMFSVTESDIARRPSPTEIFRSLRESIELVSQAENEWLLAVDVGNHRVEFDTEGLKGRFLLRATAARPDDKLSPPGSGKSDDVLIAIADPNKPPPTPKLRATTPEKFRPGSESDWLVPISANDPEAGIGEIVAGFDTDNDGQLGEKEQFEETRRTWLNPLDETERRITLRIPSARLQDKPPGKHRLLVIAKNGVSKFCKDPLLVPLEVDQLRGWIVVKIPNKWKLLVDGQPRGNGPGEVRLELPLGDYNFQLVHDIVDNRKGPLKTITIKKENTKDDPARLTLEPPTN